MPKIQCGDFVEEIKRLKNIAFPMGSNLYLPPSQPEIAAFSALAAALLAGDLSDAEERSSALSYELVEFHDARTGAVYHGLREIAVPAGRGWGSYFMNLSYRRDALVEAPHVIFDANSWEVAALAFRRSAARGFLMSGSHRNANGRGTADAAKTPDSIFHAVHVAWNGPKGETAAWQIHGFDLTKHINFPAGTDVVLSNGDGSVSREVADLSRLFENAGFRSYAYNTLDPNSAANVLVNGEFPGDTFAPLGAVLNVQGDHSRALGGTFVHIELEQSVRSNGPKREEAADIISGAIMAEAGTSDVLSLVVGNTYKRLHDSKAKMNRTGTHHKVHDWTLFVDVVRGDPDLIESVQFDLGSSFEPRVYICNCPVNFLLPDGSRVPRLSTRQQSKGPVVADIQVNFRGGLLRMTSHLISLQDGGSRAPAARYTVSHPLRPLQMVPMPEENFRVEIELTTAANASLATIAQRVQSRASIPVTIIESHTCARNLMHGWKLIHDGSISCSREFPNCAKFELVSPFLCGLSGLDELRKVLLSLDGIASVCNKSMGFHVHISVVGLPLSSLMKLCQNFIKYEECMDTFMPPSRRTGSRESTQYFKSNKSAVVGPNASNFDRHKALAACTSVCQLCDLMNPTGRYYKFNMQNLVSGCEPTVEFRQHSATTDFDIVSAWVRFCLAMVSNSAKYASPRSLKSSRGPEEQFDFLFQHVIKDRALRDEYRQRRAKLAAEDCAASKL